jgi:hypothetical protein
MDTSATYRVAVGPVLTGKIPYGDSYWPKFNGSFENHEIPALDIANAVYMGHPITTWHKDHWRHSKNYQLGQHLGIDFDTEDGRSSLPQLMKDPFIAKHAAFLYTTPSHTPDKPRARAIFLLDTPIHQAKNYVLAASALLWIFGTADRQCKDAVRFFYGGKPGACEMEWLANELSLDLLKDLIRRYQETGARVRRQLQRRYEPCNADEREVVDALRHIDAWGIAYDEWVAVLMAIHSEFPGENGIAIADAWADGKQGEVAQKWRSFDAQGNTTGRVGIGTLFQMAKEHGWERQTVKVA